MIGDSDSVVQAARNATAAEQAEQQDDGGAPLVLRNAPKFDDYSQGLAGTLSAEKRKLDKVREDLTDQMLTAQRVRDAEFEAAKAAYDERMKVATQAFTDANAMLEAKANDAIKAQDSIRRALDALL